MTSKAPPTTGAAARSRLSGSATLGSQGHPCATVRSTPQVRPRDATFVLACYAMMERIGGAVIPFFAVATLLTGIVLSVATPWQLLQHWWIVVKLVLAVAVIVTAVALTGDWLQQAVVQTAGASRAVDGSNAGLPAWLVVAGSGVHLLFLWTATTISVDKPWGKIKRSRRTAADRGPRVASR